MRNSSKIKLILLIFFIIFFGFLFWYFYEPTNTVDENGNPINDSGFNLFPFGDGEKPVTNIKDDSKNNSFNNRVSFKQEMPKLRQLSRIPTAGVVIDPLTKKEIHKINVENDIFDTKDALRFDEHISEIRYVSKKNGHIYSSYTNTKKERRVSNTTIQKVYDAEFWDKDSLIVRYLDKQKNVKTYSILLKEKTPEELEIEKELQGDKKLKINTDLLNFGGVFLPLNIKEYSFLPNSKKIFYLKKENEKTIGIISESFGENKKQIFKSELNEWNINWNNPTNILINSKASAGTYTLAFKLNANNGAFEKTGKVILAGNGLANYDFSKILYSGKDFEDKYHLYIFDQKTSNLKELEIASLVEKCVWSKNNIDIYCAVPNNKIGKGEPDMWYKGYTDFSDSIFKINSNDMSSEVIFNAFSEGKDFDIIKMKLDYFEDYVYFIDSMTDFAWSYKLPEKKDKIILEEKFTGVLGGGNVCSAELTLTENLKAGDRNGKYSKWAKKVISEAKILQKQMNRLGFNAGTVDGILGRNTDASIKRMQKYLGTYQDGLVGPITRGLLNNSCN